MSDADAQVKISAQIDATGATSGAAQVVGAVDKIEGATEKAGLNTDKFVEHLGGMRTGRMAAMELFEAFEGGGKTIEGTTMLLRMFLLTSMEFNPLLAAVAGLGLAFVGLWEGHKRGSEEAKVKVKGDLDETWKFADALLEASLKSISENKSFHGLAVQAKEFTDELNIQDEVIKTIQAALDRLDDAKFGAKEALLNREEQEELKGKTGEDAEAIRLKYEKELDELRGQHEKEKAQKNLDRKQAELIDLQKQKKAVEDQIKAAAGDVQRAQDAANPGNTRASLSQSDYEYARETVASLRDQQGAAGRGEADAKGQLIQPLDADQLIQLQQLTEALPQLQATETEKGPQYTEQIKRLTDQRKAAQDQEQKDLTDALGSTYELAPGQTQPQARDAATAEIMRGYSEKFADLDAQILAMSKTQDGQEGVKKALADATKASEDGNKELEKISGKITAAQTDIEGAQIEIGTAGVKSDTALQKDTNSQDDFRQKQAREIRDATLAADELRIEKGIKDNSKNPELLAFLQGQKAKLAAKKIKNETADKQAGLTLEPNVSKAIGAEGTARAGEVFADAHEKQTEATAAATKKADQQQINQIKGTIESSGNKETIQQMHLLVQKDQGNLSKLLSDLLHLMGTHITTQTQINAKFAGQLGDLGKKQRDHGRAIGNLNSLP